MPDRRSVGMLLMHGGTPRDLEAREQLAAALPDEAEVGEPDDLGVFEIEHPLPGAPQLPEHWRAKSGSPQR